MRPGASPQSRGYIYTGPGEVSSLVTDPPVTPVTPRIYIYIYIYIYTKSNRSFTSVQMCHTHTLPLAGWCDGKWGEDEDEGEVKVRWPWRWDEKLLNQDAKRGTQKKQERTPTRHTWPGTGKPWKGKGKEKRRVDGHGTRPAEGGEGRKRLNQPDTARTYTHLSTRRSQPTWGGKNAWDRGPMGISWWKHKKRKTRLSS